MKVLVTGAGGFLGRAIVQRLLARGDHVMGVQRSSAEDLERMGMRLFRGDLSDPDLALRASAGCDAILHVAAKAGHWGSYDSYFQANVLATRAVISAAQRNGIRKLVYTSTPSVAHAGGDLAGVDESTPIPKHFLAYYPATKAVAEAEVLTANSPQLSTCALRPHLIWGPGDNHLLPRLIARANANKLRFVGSGQNLIDTIYIDNAVDAHILALDRLQSDAPCAGRAYFLSNGEPLAMKTIINRLLACVGIAPVDRHIGIRAARVIAKVMEAAYTYFPLKGEPLLTPFLVEQFTTAHWYNIDAAKRDLGYHPRISMNEGMGLLTAHCDRSRHAI
jgi:2-alkyl-3-oxoalkanoate reductase